MRNIRKPIIVIAILMILVVLLGVALFFSEMDGGNYFSLVTSRTVSG